MTPVIIPVDSGSYVISTVVGGGSRRGDQPATAIRIDEIADLAADGNGNIYIAQDLSGTVGGGAHKIWNVAATGNITRMETKGEFWIEAIGLTVPPHLEMENSVPPLS